MKVGIISDRLNNPSLDGIGVYIFNLINEFLKLNSKNVYLVDYKKNERFPKANTITVNNNFKCPKSSYFWYLYLNCYYFNKKNIGLDIIHSPDNSSLFTKLKNQKKIITVYDIMPFYFSNMYSYITHYRYKLLFPKTLKTSDKIITISIHTKKDLIKYFKIPENKIKVIHLAANENYKPLNEKEIINIKYLLIGVVVCQYSFLNENLKKK